MSTILEYGSRIGCIAGLALGTACGAEAVGTEPCDGDSIQCSRQALSAYDEVAVERLTRLRPTWTRSLPVAGEAAEVNPDFSGTQVAGDRDGNLWLFARDPEGVRVSRLD